jgi:RHS repeat-associated protein
MVRLRLLRTFMAIYLGATALVSMEAGTMLPALAASPAATHPAPAASPGPAVAHVEAVKPKFAARGPEVPEVRATAVDWPATARSTVTLGTTGSVAVRAPGTPLSVRPVAGRTGRFAGPTHLTTKVLDRAASTAAGVDGVVLAVSTGDQKNGDRQNGDVQVSLDYRSFAQAYGGNYGSRLSMVELPACALTTPGLPACRTRTPLKSANDVEHQSVAATVGLGATANAVVLAAVADTDGGDGGGKAGTYAATTLKPSGSWSGGTSSGSFTYSYPIETPEASSGLAPDVALSYDSGSVDGQTAATEAQSSWVGDGWQTPQSYVEQSFTACSDSPEGTKSPVASNDECYDGPVLTLSLNGSSSSLVQDASGNWHPESDDGQVVKHLQNSGNGSGTYNTDYWSVTTRDGTTYYFGRNELPGWSSGKATTDSVDSEPVYSAHSGDPCYKSAGFTSSVCTMGYRWNLDYVTDIHGSAEAYYYQQDTNKYGEDLGAHVVSYVRESHLDHVDYGFPAGGAYGTPADKILFHTGPRCFTSTCGTLSSTTAPDWQDVPFDLQCTAATCLQVAPSFFSTVRLTSIETQQYSTTSSKYLTVDSYALTQHLPKTGDGTAPTLWLDSVVRTAQGTTGGGSTTPVLYPPVTFAEGAPSDLPNRVDNFTDGLPALYRFRIENITTETGSVITPTYSLVNPCTAPVKLTAATNTSSCYPVYWTPEGETDPFLDWFNKYVVTRVTETDPTGGAEATSTNYAYLGGAAWHSDDNEVVKAKYRTYGQFRGYGTVETRLGDGANDGGNQSLSVATYYRGMAGTLTDSQGGRHTDADQLAGMTLEAADHLGSGGPVDHTTITSYWISGATATRARTGLPALTANHVDVAESYDRQAVTGSGATTWRVNETDNAYVTDPAGANLGLLTHSYTHTVPAVATYDRCVSDSYAPVNTAGNLAGLTSETETDAVACGGFTEGAPASAPGSLNTLTAPAAVTRPDQVVTDTRSFYDDPKFGTTFPQAAPGNGDLTMTQEATGWGSGAFSYQTQMKATYDGYGRATAKWDADGGETRTAYVVNSVGVTTGSITTNPLSQSTTLTLDPQRGNPLTAVDANQIVTTTHNDAAGRITDVWADSRATSLPANDTFTYRMTATAPTTVTAKKLNDESGYVTTTVIYDAQLRQRQTQTMTPQSGRMVSDTFYDSRGWVAARTNGWWDPNTTPGTTLIAPTDLTNATVPDADSYTYDGLGRPVIDDSTADGQTVTRTFTVYNGDRTTVVPPAGSTARTTVTDPVGRTAEIDQYATPPTLNVPGNAFTGIFSVTGGTTTKTAYGFDPRGNQNSVTGADGSSWASTYDLLGRETAKSDPDAGKSTLTYDANGNVQETRDSRGKVVSYAYDALNRKIGQYDSPAASQSTANRMAAWVYDNSDNAVAGMTDPIGHLTSSTAYHDGAAYTQRSRGFNVFGESTGETVTIPSAEGALAGSYSFVKQYSATTGLLSKDVYPAQGGLPAETVNHDYAGVLDLPDLLNGLSGYDQGTTYDAFSRVNQQTLGSAPNLAYVTDAYDPHTGDLTDQLVTRALGAAPKVDDEAYRYDPSGNLTRQVSTRLGASAPSETQCFGYDGLSRLTVAWTATDACAVTPTAADHSTVGDSLGTSSAYWTTWAFDLLGNRTGQVQHGFTGGASSTDTTTSYTYDGPKTGQAHTLTGTTTTGAATGSTAYTYDASGNVVGRTTPADGTQTLTWDDRGQLTAVTGGTAGDAGYVRDADGNLLLSKDPGKTTLYLPDEQITVNTGDEAPTGSRYYALPGGGTVVRTGSGTNYQFEITDSQGTPILYLSDTVDDQDWRQFTPYGDERGTAIALPDNRGFLDKPQDAATGLLDVGARTYDATIGRFISVDPLLELNDPQQLNGYGYAAADPIDNSDPTGMISEGACATQLCHDELEQQRRDDQQSANNCATRLCHDSYTAAANCRCSDTNYGNHKYGDPRTYKPVHASTTTTHPKPKKKCGWSCKIHAAGDFISRASPVLDVLAMAFGTVPIVGQILIVAAVTADIISIADSSYNGVKEYQKNGMDLNVAIDGIGVVTSAVGLGGMGFAKTLGRAGEDTAQAGVKTAAKKAAKNPRSSKAAGEHEAAKSNRDAAQNRTRVMTGVSSGSGLSSDANTLACNEQWDC